MTLIVSPLRHLDSLIEVRKPSHVLTLISPDAKAPACESTSVRRHLLLRFNDISEVTAGFAAPQADTIQAILDFSSDWDKSAPMLIHCFAGISRSTAAAYILACHFSAPGQEHNIANTLRRASPAATPNSLMVALADDLLSRDGRMIAAIKNIGRGAVAFEGNEVELNFRTVRQGGVRSDEEDSLGRPT